MTLHPFHALGVAVLATTGGCLLEPLVDDTPGYSVNILPPGAEVPSVADDAELTHQISVNDGLDDRALDEAGGVVKRSIGWAGGVQYAYWSFGKAPRVGAAAYVLVDAAGARVDHPYLLDSVPGDPGYSPIRRLQTVTVTAAYRGERLTTLAALADALELGLIEEPVAAGTWVNAPVVPPGTTLEVGGAGPAAPVEMYARGFRVGAFVLGGPRGVQPLRNGAVMVAQASLMREGSNVALGTTPCFQYAVPAEPATMAPNYSPLSQIIEVKLAPGIVAADTIHSDSDLFTRSTTGAIRSTTANVVDFEITDTVWNWPMQFEEGLP